VTTEKVSRDKKEIRWKPLVAVPLVAAIVFGGGFIGARVGGGIEHEPTSQPSPIVVALESDRAACQAVLVLLDLGNDALLFQQAQGKAGSQSLLELTPLGTQQIFASEMAAVQAADRTIRDNARYVIDAIRMRKAGLSTDPGFVKLSSACQEAGVPLTSIASAVATSVHWFPPPTYEAKARAASSHAYPFKGGPRMTGTGST